MDFQKKDEFDLKAQDLPKSLKERIADNPSLEELGVTDAFIRTDGDIEFTMPVKHKHTNVHGIVHGGIFVTLLDTAMGYACHFTAGQEGTVTLNINASFIANCLPGSVISAVGRTIHSGRRIIVAAGEIYDENGKLLCTSQGTFYAKSKEKSDDSIKNQR